MHRNIGLMLAAMHIAGAFFSMAAFAADRLVDWTANSRTATAITGDIQLSSNRIVIGQHTFKLTLIRELNPDELAKTYHILGINLNSARLYSVNIPASITLLNGNTICGEAVTRVIVGGDSTWIGNTTMLALIFLEGDRELFYPGWEKETGHLCASFNYTRHLEQPQ